MTAANERPCFTMHRTATPGDIDDLGHVNNAVYVSWIQEVAIAHWRSLAPPAMQDATLWVIVRHEIDYRRPTHVGEAVTLTTWVGSPQGARFDRFVRISGSEGDVRVEARTFWALLDRASGRPVRVTPALARLFLEPSPPAS